MNVTGRGSTHSDCLMGEPVCCLVLSTFPSFLTSSLTPSRLFSFLRREKEREREGGSKVEKTRERERENGGGRGRCMREKEREKAGRTWPK